MMPILPDIACLLCTKSSQCAYNAPFDVYIDIMKLWLLNRDAFHRKLLRESIRLSMWG